MECSTCQAQAAVGTCRECRTALCDGCGLTCQRCKKLVCSKHSGTTSHGRLLCDSCMDERNAAIEKRRRSHSRAKRKETIEAAVAASTKTGGDMSFAALADDDSSTGVVPAAATESKRGAGDELEVEAKKVVAGAKRDPLDVSGKLELGEVDETRPLLMANAYKPRSAWRYLPALIALIAVLWFVYDRVPSLRIVVVVGSLVGGLIFAAWSYGIAKAKSETYRPGKN